MPKFYNAPEAEILEIKLVTDICSPSQGLVTDPGEEDYEGGDLV